MSTPEAIFEFEDGRYFIGIWFVGDGTKDWLCAIWRDPGTRWQIAYRFRYYTTEDPWDGKDRRSAWRGSVSGTEAEVEEKMHAMAKVISIEFGRVWFVPLHSDKASENGKALAAQPWAHVRKLDAEGKAVMNQHTIKFVRSGRGKAQCAPDPDFPHGKEMIPPIKPYCLVDLPYPARECGYFLVKCETCKTSMAITAAGRPDDPIRVGVPCQRRDEEPS